MNRLRVVMAAALLAVTGFAVSPVVALPAAAAAVPSPPPADANDAALSAAVRPGPVGADGPNGCNRSKQLRAQARATGKKTFGCNRWLSKGDLSDESRRSVEAAVKRASKQTDAPGDILQECARLGSGMVITRDATCAIYLVQWIITNATTNQVVGEVWHTVVRWSWTSNGVMRWADHISVTPLQQGARGLGLSAVHTVNLWCDGACFIESVDPGGPTPFPEPSDSAFYMISQRLDPNSRNVMENKADLVLTAPGVTTKFSMPFTKVRCDTYRDLADNIDGCVFPEAVPTARWDYSGDLWQVAQHIDEAQRQGQPGRPGTTPLQRLVDKDKIKLNRSAACPDNFPKTTRENSCDEYPFASTYQGAHTGGGSYSHKAVNLEQNTNHGNSLSRFYAENRMLDGDKFWVQITGKPADDVATIMAIGDSITHGLEGDYTWRYRLANHFEAKGVKADFVGPHQGTNRIPNAQPAGFPTISAPPVFDGAYRDHKTFDSDHFGQWGRQASQAKGDIWGSVGRYRPRYLLVTLGFNDLAWGNRGSAGLVTDMTELIVDAQLVNPGVKILVANVVHRTPLVNAPNLNAAITDYNARVGAMVAGLNSAQKPVRLVDIDSGYNPAADAYDGLHPNGIGEYKIAQALRQCPLLSIHHRRHVRQHPGQRARPDSGGSQLAQRAGRRRRYQAGMASQLRRRGLLAVPAQRHDRGGVAEGAAAHPGGQLDRRLGRHRPRLRVLRPTRTRHQRRARLSDTTRDGQPCNSGRTTEHHRTTWITQPDGLLVAGHRGEQLNGDQLPRVLQGRDGVEQRRRHAPDQCDIHPTDRSDTRTCVLDRNLLDQHGRGRDAQSRTPLRTVGMSRSHRSGHRPKRPVACR